MIADWMFASLMMLHRIVGFGIGSLCVGADVDDSGDRGLDVGGVVSFGSC